MNIVSYPVLKGPHKRSQYSSVWKQTKTEDEGGNNNKFEAIGQKGPHKRSHSTAVYEKKKDGGNIRS